MRIGTTTQRRGSADVRNPRALVLPAWTVVLAGLVTGVVLIADPTTRGGLPLLPCPIHLSTGLDCPGCGATRALYSLLHGDLPAALHYNALAIAFVPFFLWTWGAWVAGRWRGRPVRNWEQWRGSAMVAVVVLVGWFVARNLPFAPFDALYV